MPTTDPRIDAYIASAAPFAQPVLRTLRAAVHEACPEVVETIKWRMPFFLLDGHILAYMSAFKAHCGFGFWRGRRVDNAPEARSGAMGQFGRIASLADLPPAARLVELVRAAAARSPA